MKNVIKVTCSSEDRYRKILKLLSTLMSTPLSEKEIEVIDLLHKKGDVMSTEVRKEIREELGISVEYMNNYVSRLREKKILSGDRLHQSLSGIDISDESQDYMLLFQFQTTKSKPDEKPAARNPRGSKTKRT